MSSSLDAASVLEAAILCADSPLSLTQLHRMVEGTFDLPNEGEEQAWLRDLLQELQNRWQGRGLELVEVAQGWRFQSVAQMANFMDKLQHERTVKYSRASFETLAIVAYRQPCTRGDIEDIRGVGVSSQIMKQFEDRGWVEVVGYRETVGRPALFATTSQFLQDLGLQSLTDLPPIDLDSTDIDTTLLQDKVRALETQMSLD